MNAYLIGAHSRVCDQNTIKENKDKKTPTEIDIYFVEYSDEEYDTNYYKVNQLNYEGSILYTMEFTDKKQYIKYLKNLSNNRPEFPTLRFQLEADR